MSQPRPLFNSFSVFLNNSATAQKINVKNSVLGFELKTSWSSVSSHNGYTKIYLSKASS